jgi:hypothetical protein
MENNRLKNIKLIERLGSIEIKIEGKLYNVTVNNWNFENDIFMACKISKNNLIINRSYPLFKSVKYTDIFIKLHVMLINQLNTELLTEKTYSKISKKILDVYSDYIK